MSIRSYGLTILASLALAAAARAQTPAAGEPPVAPGPQAARSSTAGAITREPGARATVRAFRMEGGIDVDGRLDERHYTPDRAFDDLVQAVPVSGGEPSERTEVWLGFDDSNL
jgi:hypothetical protein